VVLKNFSFFFYFLFFCCLLTLLLKYRVDSRDGEAWFIEGMNFCLKLNGHRFDWRAAVECFEKGAAKDHADCQFIVQIASPYPPPYAFLSLARAFEKTQTGIGLSFASFFFGAAGRHLDMKRLLDVQCERDFAYGWFQPCCEGQSVLPEILERAGEKVRDVSCLFLNVKKK
jgi:hypothetical protein